jgi:hypothetical protein
MISGTPPPHPLRRPRRPRLLMLLSIDITTKKMMKMTTGGIPPDGRDGTGCTIGPGGMIAVSRLNPNSPAKRSAVRRVTSSSPFE